MSRLDDALSLAATGFYVFPCNNPDAQDRDGKPSGKRPRVNRWQEQSTTDPARITAWWGKWPAANIGIDTGKSGLLVVDIDPKHSGTVDVLPLAAAELGTVTQETGGGGLHLFYRQPIGVEFGNRAGKLAPGIDTRGVGGYVVAPGSIHPETGVVYRWTEGKSPADLPILPLPFALGVRLQDTPAPPPSPAPAPVALATTGRHGENPAYVQAALAKELATLSGATDGNRNDQLNRSAYALGQIVAAGALVETEVVSALEATALAIGLDKTETAKTIASGLAKGKNRPRQIPEQKPARKSKGKNNGKRPAAPGPVDETAPAKPKSYNHTDVGNGLRFLDMFGDQVRYVPARGKWFIWEGRRWIMDELGRTVELSKQVPLAMYAEGLAEPDDDRRKRIIKWALGSESAGRLTAMLNISETDARVATPHEALDSDTHLLNVNNGTIDLRTGELLSHDRKRMITKLVPIDYDPNATFPRWFQFLHEVMNDDSEMVQFLQRAVGYSLTGEVIEHAMFFLHGDGNNGKSVFSEILTLLIADYGRRASSETFMLKHGQGGANNDVARLAGSRLVIASETEKGRRLNENLVKDMVSGDTVTARFLYEEAFEFTPTHKIWMYGNHKPTITGDDFGIWRRMRLIPFDVIIPEVKRDPRLPEKLRDELPGILAWAVRGAIEWYKNGLMTPSAVMRATDKYRDEQDALGEWIDEACIEHVDARVNTKAFYNAYIAYCDAAGERPIKKKDFNDRVVKKGFIRGKFAGYWHYFGIGLANQEGQAEMKV